MKNYTMATIEEYLALPQDNTKVIALSEKIVEELKNVRKDLLNSTMKKYVINARQAQTNAKIVEALIS